MTLKEKPRRILIVVSNVDRVVAFELLCELIDKSRFSIEFLLLNPGPSYLEEYLKENGIPVSVFRLRGRLDYLSAFPRILWKLVNSVPDVINTHLIDASLLALPAAWIMGVKSRVLSRHHSTFHHVYAPRWVIIDRLLTAFATKVIAVSPLVKRIMVDREKAPDKKITVVEHGFNLEHFREVSPERIKAIQTRYGFGEMHPVIGVVSRFIKWKGIQFIIPAFKRLLESYPNAILCLANASGPDAEWILSKLEGIPAESVRKITFEPDHYALFRTFDVFVHVPVNLHCEAFGQVYVEALASGLPSIFTLSGIGSDLAEDKKNALVVPHENSEAIHAAMVEILTDKFKSENLRTSAITSVQRFGIREMIRKLELVYSA